MTNFLHPVDAFELEDPLEDNFSYQPQNFPVFRYDEEGNFAKISNHKYTWIENHNQHKPGIIFYDTKENYTKKTSSSRKSLLRNFIKKVIKLFIITIASNVITCFTSRIKFKRL